MRARTVSRVLAFGACAALLVGCGSRVASTGMTAGEAAGSGLGLEGSLGEQSQDGGTQPATASVPVAQLGEQTSTAEPTGGSTSIGATSSVGASGAKAPGVTATTITVGTYYMDSAQTNALVSGLGISNSTGDQQAQQRAIVSYINAHGGVAGRKLQLVQHKLDTQADPGTETQAVCSDWTQDHKVYAGLGGLPTNNNLLVQCMVKQKTLTVGGMTSDVGVQSDFQRFAPYYYAPASIELVTAGRIYGQGLVKQHFFSSGAKVGILYVEQPQYEAALKLGLLPALTAAGVKNVQTTGIAYDGSYSDYFGLISRTQSAVLRYKALGIDHVLFVDAGGALSYWFLNNANGQNYSPHYGFSTLSSTAFLATSFKSSVLDGAVSVGWIPPQDASSFAGLPSNAARSLCQSIMDKAGLKPVSAFDGQFQLAECSVLFFFKAVMDRATGFSIADVAKAIVGLGRTDVPSAAGIADYYAPGKAWGGNGYANLRYDAGCSCFRFTGPVQSIH